MLAALQDLQPSLQSNQFDLALYQRLRYWAYTRPDAPCLLEAGSGVSLSYGAFFAATLALRRRLGPSPRRIALRAHGGLFAAAAWVAALTGGHTLIPLSPDAPAAEVAVVTQRLAPDIAPDIALDDDSAPALASGLLSDLAAGEPGGQGTLSWPLQRLTTQDLMRDMTPWLSPDGATPRSSKPRRVKGAAPEPEPSPGAVFLTTSGSTGEPKGVLLQARQIAWTAEQIRLSHQLTPEDRGFTSLPFFHINAPVVSLCASLMAGSAVVVAPRFSRTQFWSWIEAFDITWASLVPTILALLLDTDKPAFLPGRLRFVRTASAPLPATHMREFERRFGAPVIETYGLTEAASTVCATPLPPRQRKPGSVGLPAGVSLRICEPAARGEQDDTAHPPPLRDVAPGAAGEVCVAGPSIITGYAQGRSASAFQEGWFRTGDLGYLDAEGYLFLTGRLRDIIIRGGENISPREVEETLLAHPAITEAAVIGAPDTHYGEQVVAFVTAREPWSPALEAGVRGYLARRLDRYKHPAHLLPLDALPRTASGKLDRPRLRTLWRELDGAVCAPEGPPGPTPRGHTRRAAGRRATRAATGDDVASQAPIAR